MELLTSLIVLSPIIICIIYYRYEWNKMKSEIQDEYSELLKDSPIEKDALKATILPLKEWVNRFELAFQGLKKQILGSNFIEEQEIQKILTSLNPKIINKIARKGYDDLKQVLENGEVQSLLMKYENTILYSITLPGLHDHPNLLKRYPLFRNGWIAHLLNMIESLKEEKVEDTVFIQLTTFLSPNHKEGLLYLSILKDGQLFLPERLIAKDLKLDSPELIRLSYTQSL